ncbi:AraC family transcriptional regulator [Pseudomaricurvus alkylphenolicus]|uniref:AraC family transcriptional regulator n=1 Tax=Pseudomaricurvus alkylphenolicus TaxID=1306991 RepID=UPI001422E553|nr:AraC family transcriptional regulator [Pseudomaricurvus alkylphenolicus]NIB40756.1 AraC family transcriptional regulator [Pseudomaricurvus alkylphenolicus]
MDALSALLQDLDFNAEVFFSGSLCGLQAFEEHENSGLLHFLKSGSMTLITDQDHELKLEKASVIFMPSGSHHRIQIKEFNEAELVCANIQFQPRQKTVLVDNLPKFLCIDIDQDEMISDVARWIFEEAFGAEHGRQIMIDRLCDVFVMQILRYVIRNGIVEMGTFAASSHPQLSKLMKALTANPEKTWTVDTMAESVAMSRSKFAALFKDSVGQAPMEYLTDLRLSKAQNLLTTDKPVALVANEVGYEDASSLARVFKKRFGVTPKQWLKQRFGSRRS